jgi:hypothetical protein
MTLGRNDATRSLHGWMAGRFRRLAYEVAVRLLDRIGKGSALDDRQRAWLIGELEADLSDQIEDFSGQVAGIQVEPPAWMLERLDTTPGS